MPCMYHAVSEHEPCSYSASINCSRILPLLQLATASQQKWCTILHQGAPVACRPAADATLTDATACACCAPSHFTRHDAAQPNIRATSSANAFGCSHKLSIHCSCGLQKSHCKPFVIRRRCILPSMAWSAAAWQHMSEQLCAHHTRQLSIAISAPL